MVDDNNILRPKNIKYKAKFKILSLNASQGSGGTVENCGLFDSKIDSSWNSSDMFYWQNYNNYIEIQIFEKCNIWRFGCSWDDRYGELQILQKQDNGEFLDVTERYSIPTTDIKHSWEMFVKNLPKGIYKFIGGYEKRSNSSYRLDAEWFIEKVFNIKCIIKQDNKFYSIKKEFFKNNNYEDLNITTITEDVFVKYGFNISDYCKEIYIDTLKTNIIPINLFKTNVKLLLYNKED